MEQERKDREKALRALEALREEAKQNGLQDMTLEEINEEIRKVREARYIESLLDEADDVAMKESKRFMHEKVFGKIG